MGFLSAQLFRYVQDAAFYRELHRRAVELLPPGSGRVWFDVGCGPGLVARLASERGYRATGWDVDRAMIEQARRVAGREASSVRFAIAGIDAVASSPEKADVVSAASLLAVLDDSTASIRKLLACLKEEGVLLVIETTPAMQPRAAWAVLRRAGFGGRNWVLLLWAWTRRNRQAVDLSKLGISGISVARTELLGGLVAAWVVRRGGAHSSLSVSPY